MTTLTHSDLRLFFMREGKQAGNIAAWPDDADPSFVTEHLELLSSVLNDDLAAMTEDERNSLFGTYLGAARRHQPRAPLDPHTDPAGLELSRVLARIFSLDGFSRNEDLRKLASTTLEKQEWIARQHLGDQRTILRELRDAQDQLELASREECRATASVEVREFIARTASNSDEDVSFTEIRHLYQELGRLAGPMQIIEEQGGGEVVSEAVKVITAAYAERTRKERKFDNATATFVTLAWRDRETERLDAMLEEVEKARDLYFADFPLGAPLPQDEGERGKEEERRASQRVLAIQRATKAIQELVAPLRAQWMSRLVAAEEISARLEERRSASGSLRPEAQKYGVSPRGAEYWVADAMRWLGAHDAEVTQQSQDGGVDVITGRFAVSVKHYAGSVPVEEIREIFGVAITMRKLPILWTSGTLTKAASDFADLAPVAVVQYRVEDASVTGLNEAGRELLAAGVGDEHESLPPTI